MNNIQARIIVKGLVQGVFFRDFTMKKAKALGLTGFVRNLENRSVEILVEGREDYIQKLIKEIKLGSEQSNVEDVKVELGVFENKFFDFKITYF